ncbi:MAG: accessory gene regulator B family protein [Clostridium sp.]|nr:accessory gene regulator B family protein [Clostridium sp.]
MRFIHVLSFKGADCLMKQMRGNHESRRIHYFGLQVVIGAIVKGFLLLLLSAMTGTLVSSIVIVITFVLLRTIAGGYHMNTYGKCIGISLGMFLMSAVISKYTPHMWNGFSIRLILLPTFVLSFLSLVKWAPADNPNRPITSKKEAKKFKALSIFYILVWFAINLVLVYFNQYMFSLALCFGVILEVFTITPLGINFFTKLEHGMDSIKK